MNDLRAPQPRALRLTLPAWAVAALIAAAGAGGMVGAHAVAPKPVVTAAATPPATPVAAVAVPDFSQIAQQYGNAVVNISVSGSRKVSAAEADPVQEFFRRFQGLPPGAQGNGGNVEVPVRGLGSGFIVAQDGVILTNAHVVQDAKEVIVRLTDRREFNAKVLGADAKTDIAVLKIDAKNLPTVRLGDPAALKTGEWVLAIGSPFGFDNSVTAGVVSAVHRSLPSDSAVPFIQTDVAVNPGNSGGPLFNGRGEVVGINAQIYSRSGGYQGLSFAIPIDLAQRVQQQIQKTGRAAHAQLGVTVQEVNQSLADSFKLDRPEGALVSQVMPDSPAAKAGLQPGDVIRQIDGKPVVASADLPAVVGMATPGDKVKLQVWRDGKAREVIATLGTAQDPKTADAGPDSNGVDAGQGRLGLALRPLQPDEKRAAGIREGLLIAGVAGAAAQAGLQPGDVLLAVNSRPVDSVDQVRSAAALSDSVALLIQRGQERLYVPLKPEKKAG
jgi:serine protease Do